MGLERDGRDPSAIRPAIKGLTEAERGLRLACRLAALLVAAAIPLPSAAAAASAGNGASTAEEDKGKPAATAEARGLGVAPDTAAAPSVEGGGRRWAFLVGLNEYENWPDLNLCLKDAKAFRGVLLEKGGFEQDAVQLMSMDAEKAHDHPYTARQILKRFRQFLEGTGPDDVVLFYFAGHGDCIDGRSYLIPYDASIKDGHVIAEQGVPTKEVCRLLEDYEVCKARHKLIILDACHSGGERSAGDVMPRGFSTSFEESAATIATIASCTEGQTSLEDPKLGHGIFTHFLLEGFGGKADVDGNRRVSLTELVGFVSRETTTYAKREFNREQLPKLILTSAGLFDVAVLETQSTGPVDPLGGVGSANLPPTHAPKADPSLEMILIPGPRPYYIAKHEVSQEQYKRFCTAARLPFPASRYKHSFGAPEAPPLPMVNVSQEEASLFCESLGLSLPTVAQWTLASERLAEVAEENPGRRYALDVTNQELSRTPEGLTGMSDNVSEWCSEEDRCCGGAWNSVRPSLEQRKCEADYADWLGFRPCYVPGRKKPGSSTASR